MGHDMVKNPVTAFIHWFDALPPGHRQRLAHIFFVCTTQHTGDMLAEPRHSLDRFVIHFTRPDFPLRVVSRVFTVRALFDLLLMHRKELVAGPEEWLAGHGLDNMIPLDAHQWDRVSASWAALRSRELADPYLHAWAAAVLKKKKTQKKGSEPSNT
jgi:hypothetical protein